MADLTAIVTTAPAHAHSTTRTTQNVGGLRLKFNLFVTLRLFNRKVHGSNPCSGARFPNSAGGESATFFPYCRVPR